MNNNFFEILTFFIIYSFLGWILESVVRSISEKKLINTGFLNGPFCPIYGCGAIIMILFLRKFTNNYLLLFLISFVILSAWEYIVGFFLEKTFKTKYWDYSNKKFNLQGRVCLENSICWGILGVLFIKYIHPFVLNIVEKIDNISIQIVVCVATVLFIVDAVINVMKLINIKSTLEKIEKINEQIKEKLSENKNIDKLKAQENITQIVDELKIKRDRILKRLYKHVYRLKKAFPAIYTNEIAYVLNKKIEIHNIIENKKKIKEMKKKEAKMKKEEKANKKVKKI